MEIITSRNNAKIAQLASLLRDAKLRDKSGLFVVEGVKLTREAIAAKNVIELYITEDCLARHGNPNFTNTTIVKSHVYEKLTMLKSPEGICALCARENATLNAKPDGRYLVLCDIQNPDNAGAMIRTAAALGFNGVISCGGSSITSPKLIRAAAGATFVIPHYSMELDEFLNHAKQAELTTVATSPTAKTPLTECNTAKGVAILIGNEGSGLPQDVIKACDCSVKIEITGFESLNAAVAAGIIMYHFKENI